MEVFAEGGTEGVGFFSLQHFLTRNNFSNDLVSLVELDSDSQRSVGVIFSFQRTLHSELTIQSTDLHKVEELESEIVQSLLHHTSTKSVGRGNLFFVENEVLVVLLVAQRAVESLSGSVQELESLFGVHDQVIFHFGSLHQVNGLHELFTVGILQELGVVGHSGGQVLNLSESFENNFWKLENKGILPIAWA